MLANRLGAPRLTGYDCSSESIGLARSRYSGECFDWTSELESIAPESFDVAYTSGVFHHIPPDLRAENVARIYDWLKPGGLLALFENNPWNPGTRWVMSRIPFDRDAICLTPIETRRRLRATGFDVEVTRFLFYFPSVMSFLRPMERFLERFPLGAQYVVFGEETGGVSSHSTDRLLQHDMHDQRKVRCVIARERAINSTCTEFI